MADATDRAPLWLRRAILVTAVTLAVLMVAATLVHDWLKREYLSPGPAAAASRIQVEQGSSVRAVLVRLESQGVVHNARAVVWYLRLLAEQPRMQAGTYEIPPHASPEQIITMFEEGKVLLEQLTVLEGSTFADFLELLAHEPDVTHTLAGKTPAEVMAAFGHPGENPEGRFFPDTYRFAANTADVVILGVAYEKMTQELAAAWTARSPKLPFDSPAQALILASMVEKEAQLKAERRRIAGVFVARLRKGMRLQSDPTVIYGLGGKYDGQIHTRDLLTDTPYNTYTRAGLPPAPIALPGLESLMAAVQPDDTGELYFVASGLGDGAHHFSRTLQEHNSAVKAYLGRLRQQRAAARAEAPAPAPVAKPTAKKSPQRTAPVGAGTHP
jgi:peptidoglycan lytic transglycosylase G